MNNNDRYIPSNHTNDAVETFHLHKNSIPDSRQDSSDKEDKEHLTFHQNKNSIPESQQDSSVKDGEEHLWFQHKNSIPDSQQDSSDKEHEEHSWDSYSDNMSSTQTSPAASSRWSFREQPDCNDFFFDYTGLITSLVREGGNIHSLAATGDMLYTGSESKNIRVWKNRKEFSGFKSTSGLVKAIVIANEKIFTGHRDGKIRVWKASSKNPVEYRKIGTLPDWTSVMKKSIQPKNYTEVRKNRNAIWIKHFDVISSLCLSEDHLLLYSGSWDKTIKVWNVLDFKCLESIPAHDDAVNAVTTGFDDIAIFSCSADGAVKAWRRDMSGKRTKHSFLHTLLNQDSAVTSLIVNPTKTMVYAGLSDGVMRFWERDTLLSSGMFFKCHKLAVLSLAVASGLVFSGSADTNIHVWRREDDGEHKCVHVLRGHGGPVKCLAVDMGGDECPWTTLYSGSLDGSVKIWRVATQTNREEDNEPVSMSPSPSRLKDR